jgi:Zn finger protein HypA/HybF involved in hydrogenase expression
MDEHEHAGSMECDCLDCGHHWIEEDVLDGGAPCFACPECGSYDVDMDFLLPNFDNLDDEFLSQL